MKLRARRRGGPASRHGHLPAGSCRAAAGRIFCHLLMLGRKREVLERKQPSKRRWQKELDSDEGGGEAVTAEELEQWREREEHDREERDKDESKLAKKDSVASSGAHDEDGGQENLESKKRKRFAWMDSDEDGEAEAEAEAEEEERGRSPQQPGTVGTYGNETGASPSGAVDEAVSSSGAPSAPPPAPPPVPPPAPPPVRGFFGPSAAPVTVGLPPPPPVPHLFPVSAAAPGPTAPPRPPVPPMMAGFASPPAVVGLVPGLMQPGAWSRPVLARASVSHGEERLVGRIKRYVDLPNGGGYGFIDCEDTKLRFSRDVYIHKNQMNGLQIGDEVTFTIVRNSKGDPQARNVMRSEDSVLLRHVPKIATVGMVGMGHPAAVMPAAALATASADGGLMDEDQARQFQAALRGTGL